MSETNIMEGVRQFLRTYPPLYDDKINVDFLPEEEKSYAVEAVPAQQIIRSYVDGSSVRQFLFVVASREPFSEEVHQQMDNLHFYEDFSAWLREQTMGKNLPELGHGRTAILVEATTPGYVMTAEENMARYQIQCRLEYFEKK